MVKEADLNILISNVLNENHHKNCRLCLRDLADPNFVRFEDFVSLEEHKLFQPLSEVLSNLLGQEICQEIPGVDAVCSSCVEKALECTSFIEHSKKSSTLLHKIFDSLSEALHVEVEDSTNQRLYVIVGENESKVVLIDKNQDSVVPQKVIITENKNNSKYAFECEKCKEVFASEYEMNVHEKNGHIFECPYCDQNRCSEDSLKDHQDKAHTVYVCKDCGKSCHGLDKLESHEKRHNTTKHQCPKCDKVYLTQCSYMKHVELCLAEKLEAHPYRGKYEKTHFCEKCGKGYSTSGGLRVHERFEHGNAKPHICEHCGKKFTAPSYLKIHMVKHTGEKKFNCSICNKNFVSKEALLYHTRRHTGEKPFSCNLCSERFVNASARAEHIKFKHSGPTLPCDICQRKFFTSSFLKQHRKRHLDPVSKLYVGRSVAHTKTGILGEESIKSENFSIKEERGSV